MSNDDKNIPTNFEINKRHIIIISVLLLIFIFLVIRAFTYIPEPNNNTVLKRVGVENLNSSGENTVSENSQETYEASKTIENADENEELKGQKVIIPSNKEIEFETIKAPDGAGIENSNDLTNKNNPQVNNVELTPEDNAKQALMNAKNYVQNKQYAKALNEYQKIPDMVKDNNLIASSYEGIAELYAINRRYGTALSYATKAFNMSPSSSREMLIARLYYKTGDIDKATKRINNILHRDFADDK